jgi:hypothetical protein
MMHDGVIATYICNTSTVLNELVIFGLKKQSNRKLLIVEEIMTPKTPCVQTKLSQSHVENMD